MKHILTIIFFFNLTIMLGQSLSNDFCLDISKDVIISKDSLSLFIYHNNNDYTEIKYNLKSDSIIGCVKNENVINILGKMSEKYNNSLFLLSVIKNGKDWTLEGTHDPITLRYFNKKNQIKRYSFPDINTLLVNYVFEDNTSVEHLYRITEYGIIEYDMSYGKNSIEREKLINSLGKPHKQKFRPKN